MPISPGPGTPPRSSTAADRRTPGSARNQPCSERNSPAPSPTCSSNRTPTSPDPHAHPTTVHNRPGNPLQRNTTTPIRRPADRAVALVLKLLEQFPATGHGRCLAIRFFVVPPAPKSPGPARGSPAPSARTRSAEPDGGRRFIGTSTVVAPRTAPERTGVENDSGHRREPGRCRLPERCGVAATGHALLGDSAPDGLCDALSGLHVHPRSQPADTALPGRVSRLTAPRTRHDSWTARGRLRGQSGTRQLPRRPTASVSSRTRCGDARSGNSSRSCDIR